MGSAMHSYKYTAHAHLNVGARDTTGNILIGWGLMDELTFARTKFPLMTSLLMVRQHNLLHVRVSLHMLQ